MLSCGPILTILRVLSCDLGNGVADLVTDAAVGLGRQDLEQLLADDLRLRNRKGNEDLDGIALFVLARL